MAKASEVIAHIMAHLEAEAATADRSQAPGVAERARYARAALQQLARDTRSRSRDEIMLDVSHAAAVDAKQEGFQRTIRNLLGDSRPHHAVQRWVGQNTEGVQRG